MAVKPDRVAGLSEGEQFVKAKDTIGWILSNSPQTSRELYRKLVKKGYSPEVAETAIVWAREYGFIDDVSYAEMFIREYVFRVGKSVSWAKNRLRAKGVENTDVDEALERLDVDGVFGVEAERERALTAGRVAMRRIGQAGDEAARQRKFFSRLARLGYSYDICVFVWKTLSGESGGTNYYDG